MNPLSDDELNELLSPDPQDTDSPSIQGRIEQKIEVIELAEVDCTWPWEETTERGEEDYEVPF